MDLHLTYRAETFDLVGRESREAEESFFTRYLGPKRKL